MAVQIIHKNSAVKDKSVTAAQISYGELAINYDSTGPYLQAKADDNTIWRVGGVTVDSDAPGSPLEGTFWFNTASDQLFLRADGAWHSVGSGGGSGGSGDVDQLIGGDGIDIAPASGIGTVTITVDQGEGLKFTSGVLEVDLAGGNDGLEMSGGRLKASVATTTTIGSVSAGTGLSVDGAGELTVDAAAAGAVTSITAGDGIDVATPGGPSPTISVDLKSGVDGGLRIDSTELALQSASTTQLGGIKVGNGLEITGGNVLNVEDGIIKGMAFQGDVDLTAAKGNTNPDADANVKRGYSYVNTASGAMSATWRTATGEGATSTAEGDLLIANKDNPSAAGDWTYVGTGGTQFWDRNTASGGIFDGVNYLEPSTSGDAIYTAAGVGIGNSVADPNVILAGNGLGTFKGGVSVTGGKVAIGPTNADARTHVLISGSYATAGSNETTLRVEPEFVRADTGGVNGGNGGIFCNPKQTSANAVWNKGFVAQGTAPSGGISVTNYAGFFADNGVQNGGTNAYGFYSRLGNASGHWNFFSDEGAPNFFAGNTYIGGTTARNTRELWESLLTEEQQEELTAGTLAIPANVSTPGDGSFVRQWWYDQQSAEDQALIDAGELDYPERLQAANFVDTFALGDNTKINFDSVTGLGEFRGGVKVTGGSFSGIGDGILRTASGGNTQTYLFAGGSSTNYIVCESDGNSGINGTNPDSTLNVSTQQDKYIGVRYIYEGTVDADKTEQYGYFTNIPRVNAANTVDKVSGYYTGIQANRKSGTKTIGYESEVVNSSVVGQSNYNFYAEGTAPNYFKGTTYVASDSDNLPATDNSGKTGVGVTAGGYIVSQYDSATPGSAAWNLNRTGSTTGKLVQFKYADAPGTVSQVAGYIALTSANTTSFTQTSDYRLKENIVDLPNATSRLQALKPYQYNFKNDPDVLHEGFVAHELQENTVLTVFGTKDATEAIGTLADYNGIVLETEVTEPSAEELEYTEEVETDGVATMVTRTRTWTATGTRPVYQGVDQTKLIPLLTKALQEALERIEVLEGLVAS